MKIQFDALQSSIESKRPAVNKKVYQTKTGGAAFRRSRLRSSGESEALTALVLAKKRRAVQEGTFIIKSAGKIYFDAY